MAFGVVFFTKTLKLKKNPFLFYYFFSGYYFSIDLKRQSKHYGLRLDTSRLFHFQFFACDSWVNCDWLIPHSSAYTLHQFRQINRLRADIVAKQKSETKSPPNLSQLLNMPFARKLELKWNLTARIKAKPWAFRLPFKVYGAVKHESIKCYKIKLFFF